MKCPICDDEFSGRADAKTCGKDACRKKLQRLQKENPNAEILSHREKKITLPSGQKDTLEYTAIRTETPESWLTARIEQTGSKSKDHPEGWRWVKTGNPAGSMPDIKVPIKWELSDIDKSMEFRGQWGERLTA